MNLSVTWSEVDQTLNTSREQLQQCQRERHDLNEMLQTVTKGKICLWFYGPNIRENMTSQRVLFAASTTVRTFVMKVRSLLIWGNFCKTGGCGVSSPPPILRSVLLSFCVETPGADYVPTAGCTGGVTATSSHPSGKKIFGGTRALSSASSTTAAWLWSETLQRW